MKKISTFLAIMIVLSTLFSVSAFAIDSLDFTWGDRVSIENTESSPMVCSQTIKNCTSLTFNYSVDGENAPGRWVAYCKNTNGDNKWHKVKDFIMEDYEGSIVINFSQPRTFNQLAIFKVSRYYFSYTYNYISITDVKSDSTSASATNPYTAPKSSQGSAPKSSGAKYTYVSDLPSQANDMDQLVKDWLAYPAYREDFHAVDPEVTINVGERTKLLLFRSGSYNASSYEWTWYGGGDVTLDWAGNGAGWAGHNNVGYFTATQPCTIFVYAKDSEGQIAHMVIHAK